MTRFKTVVYPTQEWVDAHNNPECDPNDYLDGYDIRDCGYLVDTVDGKEVIIYSDNGNSECPEDFLINRGLTFFVDWMNSLAEE